MRGRRERGLIAGLAVATVVALAGCGEKDEPESAAATEPIPVSSVDELAEIDRSDPRAVAVGWAALLAAEDPAVCKLATNYGKTTMMSWTSMFSCERLFTETGLMERALLVDDLGELPEGLATATAGDAVSFDDDPVQRYSFGTGDGASVAVDVAEGAQGWAFQHATATVDPLAGPGSEAIDESAADGVDRSDPQAVLQRWAELFAANDPSACLLTAPEYAYSMVRGGLGESCAEVVESGRLTFAPGGARAIAAGAPDAELESERPSQTDPGERERTYGTARDGGGGLSFVLASDDGEWAVRSFGAVGSVEIIGPGERIGRP